MRGKSCQLSWRGRPVFSGFVTLGKWWKVDRKGRVQGTGYRVQVTGYRVQLRRHYWVKRRSFNSRLNCLLRPTITGRARAARRGSRRFRRNEFGCFPRDGNYFFLCVKRGGSDAIAAPHALRCISYFRAWTRITFVLADPNLLGHGWGKLAGGWADCL